MKKFGFTLIELLIVIAIIGIMTGIGVARYLEFNKNQTVKSAALNLKNDLRQTQEKAMAGEKPAGCDVNHPLLGHKLVFTDTHNYKIVAVCQGMADVDVMTGLSLGTNVTVTGTPSVMFKVLGQGVASAQTFCLNGFSKIYKLSVTTTGEIKDEGFTTCS